MVLRIISLVAILYTIYWCIRYFKKRPGRWQRTKTWYCQEFKNAFSKEWKKNWQRIVYFLLLFTIAILALTGLIPYLIFGVPMFGFILMLHVAVAPLFALLITIIILSWANNYQFDKSNWTFVKTGLVKKERPDKEQQQADKFYEKFFFWFMVFFSIMVTSMVLSMYPIWGTVGQETLLQIHRFGAVALLICTILHTIRLVQTQIAETESP